MIFVGRVGKHQGIKVDRTTKLGNPFFMAKESMRDEVCDKYEIYFQNAMRDKSSDVYKSVVNLYRVAQQSDVTLLCHCAPKRCHADTIKNFLDQYIKE